MLKSEFIERTGITPKTEEEIGYSEYRIIEDLYMNSPFDKDVFCAHFINIYYSSLWETIRDSFYTQESIRKTLDVFARNVETTENELQKAEEKLFAIEKILSE